ncbi:mechanosensitive ion channel protein [Streptomyces violaceusniger]|uniref:Large conductance mechanosensitive channel protein MscL n=3 Tax=Streptomyces TaxID=1883 RepID=A0ABD5JMM6_9ACTN|nr:MULTISPECIES: large conductance mechanosensitive channel protein MscL [Streptomyces]AJZ82429.2 large conductance mechanosensitive channel protein MscL [Streptomyces sp. AgN23]KUL44172.1 mechanosensitive ion channel protein [Streptomyces violaceusniger]MEE4588359.1 large conductance mechanosensitive channel protein MscL [Streptomyces sp. DSM 41602]WTB11553.1 large conductance mechanosensitive channel protein MscL [Streptomyces antimycoticus]
MEGFKAFLMRGNVIDLAVAVVIGAAFTAVVNSIVKGLINPIVGAFGTKDLEKYRSCLKAPCETNAAGDVIHGIPILWGSVLSAVLTFLITAAVVYFLMVLPMSRYLARKAAKEKQAEEEQAVAEAEEILLLRQIRDELVAQRASAVDGGGSGSSA